MYPPGISQIGNSTNNPSLVSTVTFRIPRVAEIIPTSTAVSVNVHARRTARSLTRCHSFSCSTAPKARFLGRAHRSSRPTTSKASSRRPPKDMLLRAAATTNMVRSSGSSKIRKASMISFKVAAPGALLSPRSIRERLPASRLHKLASLVSVIPRRFLISCRSLPNASLSLRAGPPAWGGFCSLPTSEVSPELITTNLSRSTNFVKHHKP